MLGGYDVGKMVMYRKLMLVQGDTLMFFTAAFFWTELLAAIQSIPAEVLEPAERQRFVPPGSGLAGQVVGEAGVLPELAAGLAGPQRAPQIAVEGGRVLAERRPATAPTSRRGSRRSHPRSTGA